MPWGVAAAVGGAVVGGIMQNNAADKAARGSQKAADKAIAQQNLNYDRTAANLNPYINAGNDALSRLGALNNGDYSSFHASPDYQFSLTEGLKGLDRSAAARGSLYSGGHSADVLNYAQGLADQNYNSYYSKLSQLAGMGQNAASNLGSIGAGQAGSIGSYLMGNAANQASYGYDAANANANLLGQAANAFGQWYGQRNNQPMNTSSYGNGFNSLTGQGTYTGSGSLATTWGGMGNGWTPTNG
jgi:hypothetical protein